MRSTSSPVHIPYILYHNYYLGGAPFDRLTGVNWAKWGKRDPPRTIRFREEALCFYSMHLPGKRTRNGVEVFDKLSLDNISSAIVNILGLSRSYRIGNKYIIKRA